MAHATLAVAPGAKAVGYCVVYPGDHVVMGEFTGSYEFLDHVAVLLRNGFEWDIVLAAGDHWWDGALSFAAQLCGAPRFIVREPADVTDAALRKAGLWRRGQPAANAAARLIYNKEND